MAEQEEEEVRGGSRGSAPTSSPAGPSSARQRPPLPARLAAAPRLTPGTMSAGQDESSVRVAVR